MTRRDRAQVLDVYRRTLIDAADPKTRRIAHLRLRELVSQPPRLRHK